MMKIGLLAVATLVAMAPGPVSAGMPSEAALAPYCNAQDMTLYRHMVRGIDEAVGQWFPRQLTAEFLAKVGEYSIEHLKRMSSSCVAAIEPDSGNVVRTSANAKCTSAQIQRMILHNETVHYPNRVATDCTRF